MVENSRVSRKTAGLDYKTTQDNVVEFMPGVDKQNPPDVKTPTRNYGKIAFFVLLFVAIVIALMILYLKASSNEAVPGVAAENQSTETISLRAELEEAQTKQLRIAEALLAQEAELTDLRLELAETKDALELAIDPEIVQQLEARLEEQTNLIATATDEVARQVELVAQSQFELEVAKAELVQTEAQLDKAQVQTQAQAARATQAQTALTSEIGLVPARAEGMFELLSGVSLTSTTYDIGEVVYELKRPGVWDDETQYFFGSGEIGYTNNLDKATASWLEKNVLQVILPLPVVEPWQDVVLDGQTDTEREQLARIGGRWGDQTELFVLDVARQKTRNLACADAGALRESMRQLKQMAYQLGRGHSVNVRWSDSNGVIRSTVSDAQLLSNAC